MECKKPDKVSKGWKICMLDEIAKFGNGKSRSLEPGIYPVYGGNGILGYSDNFNSKDESIIIGRVGAYCGSVYYENKPIWITDNAMFCIPKNETSGLFLFYLLRYLKLNRLSEGSSHPLLTQNILKNISISIPKDPNEQTRIASILSSLDDKIELNIQMNKTLEAIAQAIFKEWFVDFRFPGFDGELVDGLPKGWRLGKGREILSILKEGANPNNYPHQLYYHYSIPAFDNSKKPTIEVGKLILSNKYFVKENTILLSKLNPRIPRIWDIRSIKGNNSVCSTEFIVLKPIKSEYYSFISFLLKSEKTRNTIIGLVTGTSGSHQRIKPEDVLNMLIIIPAFETIELFNEVTLPILNRMNEIMDENIILEQVRDSLLPRLMSGKIRVA